MVLENHAPSSSFNEAASSSTRKATLDPGSTYNSTSFNEAASSSTRKAPDRVTTVPLQFVLQGGRVVFDAESVFDSMEDAIAEGLQGGRVVFDAERVLTAAKYNAVHKQLQGGRVVFDAERRALAMLRG